MIATLLAALQLAATVPAIQIESIKTAESAIPMAASGMTGKTVTTISGRNLRIDQLEGKQGKLPGSGAGTYMLTVGDSLKFYSVDTVKKEYYQIDMAKMQSQVNAMMKSMPGMQMKFSDLDYKVEDLGDGDVLLGYPTRHFKVTNGITMNASMGDDTLSITMSSVADTYYAKDLIVDNSPMMGGDTAMLNQFRDLIPGMNANQVREESKKLPKTVPLKTVNKTVSYFGPMDMSFTVTDLVTRVEKKQVPAATFQVPAGYKKVEMPDLAAAARQ